MEFNNFDNLRNKYPIENNNGSPVNSYSNNSGRIRYTGKFKSNVFDIQVKPVSNINVDPINDTTTDELNDLLNTLSFNFIVEFETQNGILSYTSPSFLRRIVESSNSANPYYTLKSTPLRSRNTFVDTFNVPVIRISANEFTFLNEYSDNSTLSIGEEYAQVSFSKTLNNIYEYLKHINWLVSSDDGLRPATEMGSWNPYTDSKFGFESFINGNNPDWLGFGVQDSLEGLDTNATDEPDRGDLSECGTEPEFFPFGVPGRNEDERRLYNDVPYIWDNVNKKWNEVPINC